MAMSSSVDFDVFDALAVVLDGFARPLMLVQQRDRADQRQILHVVAPRARLAVEERQLPRVRIDHEDAASRAAARCDARRGSRRGPAVASSPSSVCASRCMRWMACVCSRSSLTVSTRQRFSSSSSRSMAVVVRKIITGPSTRYWCVTQPPVAGSLPVEAMVSSPSLCNSFSA